MSNLRVSKFNGCQNKSFLQDNEWFKRFHDSSHYYNIISRYANLIWITYYVIPTTTYLILMQYQFICTIIIEYLPHCFLFV